ncbi:MAG TPA: hypothetical protein VE974_03950 [Thermoanaerobaculia bacterium]|nr:hypothetical protein [Thermoanaerobaculia bacterium]
MSLLILLAILSVPLHGAEPIDPEVLALRESAWRAWFAGDEAALLSMLPEDFLAIGWGGAEISDRGKTIASSRAFKESGGRLVSLSFPETRAQRFGDTVVFYGSYEVTIGTGTTEERVRGRLTEVRQTRRPMAPSWLAPRRAVIRECAKHEGFPALHLSNGCRALLFCKSDGRPFSTLALPWYEEPVRFLR